METIVVRKIVDAKLRETGEAVGASILAVLVLLVVWTLTVFNCSGVTAKEIKTCEIACAPYRGLR